MLLINLKTQNLITANESHTCGLQLRLRVCVVGTQGNTGRVTRTPSYRWGGGMLLDN